MEKLTFTTLLICIIWKAYSVSSAPGVEQEYCLLEFFNASCPAGHAVVMATARYGQMRMGRCVETDFGRGCSEDVLRYMDAACSGRQRCTMKLPGVLEPSKPCQSGLQPFLLASYTCVPVTETSKRPCFPPEKTVIDVQNEGYIATSVTARTAMATSKCVVLVRTAPGQRINLTLFDFSGPHAAFAEHRRVENEVVKVGGSGSCVRYAVVREEGAPHPTVVCQGATRRTSLFSSRTNSLEVTFASKDVHFLLHYQIAGCPQLQPPSYGWLAQSGDGVRVGCNHTAELWHLTCDGNRWIGHFTNCSSPISGGSYDPSVDIWFTLDENHWATPVGILVVTALGIALGLLLGVLLLAIAVFIIRRKRSRCFYGDHSYEEAKLTHCDAHGVYYGPHKRGPSPRLMEHIELNQTTDSNTTFQPQQYGTMAVLKYKPPAYSSQPPSGQSSTHGSVRSVRRVERRQEIEGSLGDLCDSHDGQS